MKIKRLPAGFVIPAQPVMAVKPPSGADWVHEIKHDGYRLIVCRGGCIARIYSRNAIDLPPGSRRSQTLLSASKPRASRSTARRLSSDLTTCHASMSCADGKLLEMRSFTALDLIEPPKIKNRSLPSRSRPKQIGLRPRTGGAVTARRRSSDG